MPGWLNTSATRSSDGQDIGGCGVPVVDDIAFEAGRNQRADDLGKRHRPFLGGSETCPSQGNTLRVDRVFLCSGGAGRRKRRIGPPVSASDCGPCVTRHWKLPPRIASPKNVTRGSSVQAPAWEGEPDRRPRTPALRRRPRGCCQPAFREHAIDGPGAGGQEPVSEGFIAVDGSVPDRGRREHWDHLLEAFRAQSIGEVPQRQQGRPDFWPVGRTATSSGGASRPLPGQQLDGMLAMITRALDQLVEDPCSGCSGRDPLAISDREHNFRSRGHADSPDHLPAARSRRNRRDGYAIR